MRCPRSNMMRLAQVSPTQGFLTAREAGGLDACPGLDREPERVCPSAEASRTNAWRRPLHVGATGCRSTGRSPDWSHEPRRCANSQVTSSVEP